MMNLILNFKIGSYSAEGVAKDILCAMIQAGVDDVWKNVVPAAIEGADELIRQLKLKITKDDKRETTESL